MHIFSRKDSNSESSTNDEFQNISFQEDTNLNDRVKNITTWKIQAEKWRIDNSS